MENGGMAAHRDAETDRLPEIGAGEMIRFDCGPHVPCFNRCCSELTLPLTPYDVARLRRQTGLDSSEFLRLFCLPRPMRESGLPMFLLKMIESPDAPCPFVSPAGCSVYEDRPCACRSYPLGRGTSISREGVAERFFLVREEHCQGFGQGPPRSPAQWFREQGLEPYNRFNDEYMRLASMIEAGGSPLAPGMAAMCLLCLYQMDDFRKFLEKTAIFEKVELSGEKRAKIMEDSQAGDEAALDFAFDWLELAIFGCARDLRKKGV